ncbi:MAG: hypothetical protein MJ221_04840 [Bacilli bacterium]|nr:hypothetical protein [Bacilli bacterium]
MNYLNNEKEALKLCSIQASIFKSCIDEKLDEKDFIGRYMKSIYAKNMDEGVYFDNYEDQAIIVSKLKKISKAKEVTTFTYPLLHFIGYFYRYYCYLYKVASIVAWKEIPIEYLCDNYDVLHSLDISKACENAKNSSIVSRDTK